MTRMRLAMVLLVCATACAPIDPNQPGRVKGDDDYVTGSNLPRRSIPPEVGVMSTEQTQELMRARPGPKGAGAGM